MNKKLKLVFKKLENFLIRYRSSILNRNLFFVTMIYFVGIFSTML